MAQFSHPEFGGMSQWSSGGMTMVGDMFDGGKRDRLAGLASELSERLDDLRASARAPVASRAGADPGPFRDPEPWWPDHLGVPTSRGSQDGMRYALFGERLAVWREGHVTLHDTKGHRITGFSQRQQGRASMTLSTPDGPVALEDLPTVAS